MPRFAYKAKDGPGRVVKGEFVAESRASALAKIDELGYSPVWIREKDVERGAAGVVSCAGIGRRDVNVFTRQLASLIRSGVPILRSLLTIREQSENPRFRNVVADIEDKIRKGSMLSDAIAQYPRLFPELYVSMVKSGESAGALDKVLLRVAESNEKDEDTRKKTQAALAYPALVVAVGVITVFLMTAFFLPKIANLFQGRAELPLPTRLLLSAGKFSAQYWYWAAIALVMVAVVVKRMGSIGWGRMMLDRLILRVPVIGMFVKWVDVARFARTLSLLIESGVAIDRSLVLSANVLGNAALRAEIEDVKRGTVEQGASLTAGLKRARHFPLFATNMVAVGEESGHLEESLAEVASFYDGEIDRRTKMFTTLLEPILILVVGLVVGFIVFAMLLPIFEIGRVIG